MVPSGGPLSQSHEDIATTRRHGNGPTQIEASWEIISDQTPFNGVQLFIVYSSARKSGEW